MAIDGTIPEFTKIRCFWLYGTLEADIGLPDAGISFLKVYLEISWPSFDGFASDVVQGEYYVCPPQIFWKFPGLQDSGGKIPKPQTC